MKRRAIPEDRAERLSFLMGGASWFLAVGTALGFVGLILLAICVFAPIPGIPSTVGEIIGIVLVAGSVGNSLAMAEVLHRNR